jgi:hypothetical protein
MARDPNSVARKWASNTAASTQAVEDGIQRLRESPTAAAARRKDAYVEGVRKAVAEGKWERGLQAVSLDQWQTAMRDKGIPRIGAGAQAAEGDFASFMGEFLPHLDQLDGVLRNMPRGTLEQNIARATAAIRHNAGFKRRKR